MAYSIYDKFLTITDCKYYCNQAAKRLNLSTFDYFFDKYNGIQFPGNANLRNFEAFKPFEDWQIKFNLTKPATIRKMGLDEYITKYHQLIFNLTIRGFSFVYICKFSEPNHNEETIPHAVVEPTTCVLYREEPNHQLAFILN
jgi:hypothetical protein